MAQTDRTRAYGQRALNTAAPPPHTDVLTAASGSWAFPTAAGGLASYTRFRLRMWGGGGGGGSAGAASTTTNAQAGNAGSGIASGGGGGGGARDGVGSSGAGGNGVAGVAEVVVS